MVAHHGTKPNPFAESFPSINTLILCPFVSDWQFAFVNIAASEYNFDELFKRSWNKNCS